MSSKFQVGDEFSYIDTGNKGTILKVMTMNGTVLAKYSNYGSEHVLAENLLTNLTRPEPLNALYAAGYADAETATQTSIERQDKHVDRLLNELYHDRARLEGVVKIAVSLFEEIEFNPDEQDISSRIEQFIADNL